MTSEPGRAYVWVWLPGATAPVVAGLLEDHGGHCDFLYGRSYLARQDAVPLYLPELPLQTGWINPLPGLAAPGCIRDAGPDAWGRRVVERRLALQGNHERSTELLYLLESGSDRFGALDFQASPDEYVARSTEATLDEMVRAAELVLAGEPLPASLSAALLHGTMIGGARPKVALVDGQRHLIAKLSTNDDPYPVVKAEGLATDLARRCGISVPSTEVTKVLDRDVLLTERFDRLPGGMRRMAVSALTIAGLNEELGRYATYWELAATIRERFSAPAEALRELFTRITFNICVSNTDDHAKNHAAFWDGGQLSLAPAFDITPSLRSGGEAAQAMAIGPDGWRYSQLAGCLERAGAYGLSYREAKEIVDHQISVIVAQWDEAADRSHLTASEKDVMWRRQILNPYCLYDYPRSFAIPEAQVTRPVTVAPYYGATTTKGVPCRRRGRCPYHQNPDGLSQAAR